MRDTIWPPDKVPAHVREALNTSHHDALLILHPAWHIWQLYWSPEGKWDARRLYNAIVQHNAHNRDPEWRWWLWLGAPKLMETLEEVPGIWLVRYLDRMDWAKHPYPGGSDQWLRDMEIEDEKKAELKKARREEFTQDRLREGALHLRDAYRGDTIWRKWVANSPLEKGKVVR